MMSFISGTVVMKTEKSLLISVQGVGYEIFVPSALIEQTKIDQLMTIWTSLRVNNDQQLELYGFSSRQEVELFLQMLTVSGVGAKTAMQLVGGIPQSDLISAVDTEDVSVFRRVPGIGEKKAKKIILELKNKIGSGLTIAQTPGDHDVKEALLALGYAMGDIVQIFPFIPKDTVKVEEKIKIALSLLSKK